MGGCLHPPGSIACGCGNVTSDAAVGGGLTDTDRNRLAEALHSRIDGDFLVGAGRGFDNEGEDVPLSKARANEVVWWAVDAMEAIVARRVAAAVQTTTGRVQAALDYDRRDEPGPNGEPPEPGAWRRGARHVALRVRAALAGSTDPTPDTRTEAETPRSPLGVALEYADEIADLMSDPTHDGTPKETP